VNISKLQESAIEYDIVDPNSSVVKDIQGSKLKDFKEACWILLTN